MSVKMAVKKVLSEDRKGELSEKVSTFSKWLSSRTPPERTLMLSVMFKKLHGHEGVSKELMDYGLKQIQEVYLFKDFSLKTENIEPIYTIELEFYKRTLNSKLVPHYICCLMQDDFSANIQGLSQRVPGLPDSEFRNKIESEFLEASRQIFNKDFSIIKKNLPEFFVKDFFATPFYNDHFKDLLLRSEDPFGRKRALGSINEKPSKLYDQQKRKGLALLIEQYLFLSTELKLSEEFEEKDKESIPVQDNRVYKIIQTLRSDGSSISKIHGELRSIFDPSYGKELNDET